MVLSNDDEESDDERREKRKRGGRSVSSDGQGDGQRHDKEMRARVRVRVMATRGSHWCNHRKRSSGGIKQQQQQKATSRNRLARLVSAVSNGGGTRVVAQGLGLVAKTRNNLRALFVGARVEWHHIEILAEIGEGSRPVFHGGMDAPAVVQDVRRMRAELRSLVEVSDRAGGVTKHHARDAAIQMEALVPGLQRNRTAEVLLRLHELAVVQVRCAEIVVGKCVSRVRVDRRLEVCNRQRVVVQVAVNDAAIVEQLGRWTLLDRKGEVHQGRPEARHLQADDATGLECEGAVRSKLEDRRRGIPRLLKVTGRLQAVRHVHVCLDARGRNVHRTGVVTAALHHALARQVVHVRVAAANQRLEEERISAER
eukprot:m.11740 g.11740  ORF g.11740 m.11740 type:complete len:368 (+) comp2657_c0_seq1:88-1191(+)